MVKILGTPYERGNSDVIVARAFAAGLKEGLAVVESESNGKLTMNVGAAANVVGISGRMGIAAGDEIKAGLKVYVQAKDAEESIVIGAPVYITADGMFSQKSEGNTPVNAHARSLIEDCIDSNGESYKGFAIDFPNGL